MIKQILIWLMIIIIGGLIVGCILEPSYYYKIKYRIENAIEDVKEVKKYTNITINTSNKGGVIQTNSQNNQEDIKKIETPVICALINMIAETEGYSKKNIKKMECEIRCNVRDMNYYNYVCENGKLHCFCTT